MEETPSNLPHTRLSSVNESFEAWYNFPNETLFYKQCDAMSSDVNSLEITERILKLLIPSSIPYYHEVKTLNEARGDYSVRNVLQQVVNKLHKDVQDIVKSDHLAENLLMPIVNKCFGTDEITWKAASQETKQHSLIPFIVSLLAECIKLLEMAVDKQTHIVESSASRSKRRVKSATTLLQNIMHDVREELQQSKILSLTVNTLLYVPSLKLIYYTMKTFILRTASLLKLKDLKMERHQYHKNMKVDEFSNRLDKLWEKLDRGGRASYKPHDQSENTLAATERQNIENQSSNVQSLMKENLLNELAREKYTNCHKRYGNHEINIENRSHVKENTNLFAFQSFTGENVHDKSLENIIKTIIFQPMCENGYKSFTSNKMEAERRAKGPQKRANARKPQPCCDLHRNYNCCNKGNDNFVKNLSAEVQATIGKTSIQSLSFIQFGSEEGDNPRNGLPQLSSTSWEVDDKWMIGNSDINSILKLNSNDNAKEDPYQTRSAPSKRPTNNLERCDDYNIPRGVPENHNKFERITYKSHSRGRRLQSPDYHRGISKNEVKSKQENITFYYSDMISRQGPESELQPTKLRHMCQIPRRDDDVYSYTENTTTFSPIVAYSQVTNSPEGQSVENGNTPTRKDDNSFMTMFHTPNGCRAYNFKGTTGPIYQFFANGLPIQCSCTEGSNELNRTPDILTEGTFGNEVKESGRSLKRDPSKYELNNTFKRVASDSTSNIEVGTQTEDNEQCTCSGSMHKIFLEFDENYSQVVDEIKSLIAEGDIPLKREPSNLLGEPSRSNTGLNDNRNDKQLCDAQLKELRSLYESQPPEALMCCKCCKCQETNTSCKTNPSEELHVEISALCLTPMPNPLNGSSPRNNSSPQSFDSTHQSVDKKSPSEERKGVKFQVPRESQLEERTYSLNTSPHKSYSLEQNNPVSAKVNERHIRQASYNQTEKVYTVKPVPLDRPEYEALLKRNSDSFNLSLPLEVRSGRVEVDTSRDSPMDTTGKILRKEHEGNRKYDRGLDGTSTKNSAFQSKPKTVESLAPNEVPGLIDGPTVSNSNSSNKKEGSKTTIDPVNVGAELNNSSRDKSGVPRNMKELDKIPSASRSKPRGGSSKIPNDASQHGTSNEPLEKLDRANLKSVTNSNNSAGDEKYKNKPGTLKNREELEKVSNDSEPQADPYNGRIEDDHFNESETSELDEDCLDASKDDVNDRLSTNNSNWSFLTDDQNDCDSSEIIMKKCFSSNSTTDEKPCSFYSDTETTTPHPSQTEILVMIIESHTRARRLPDRKGDIIPLPSHPMIKNDISVKNNTSEYYKCRTKNTVQAENSLLDSAEGILRNNNQPQYNSTTNQFESRNHYNTSIPSQINSSTERKLHEIIGKEIKEKKSLTSHQKQSSVQNIKAKGKRQKGVQVTKWNVKLQTAGPKKFNRTDISEDAEDKMARYLGLERSIKS